VLGVKAPVLACGRLGSGKVGTPVVGGDEQGCDLDVQPLSCVGSHEISESPAARYDFLYSIETLSRELSGRETDVLGAVADHLVHAPTLSRPERGSPPRFWRSWRLPPATLAGSSLRPRQVVPADIAQCRERRAPLSGSLASRLRPLGRATPLPPQACPPAPAPSRDSTLPVVRILDPRWRSRHEKLTPPRRCDPGYPACDRGRSTLAVQSRDLKSKPCRPPPPRRTAAARIFARWIRLDVRLTRVSAVGGCFAVPYCGAVAPRVFTDILSRAYRAAALANLAHDHATGVTRVRRITSGICGARRDFEAAEGFLGTATWGNGDEEDEGSRARRRCGAQRVFRGTAEGS